MRPAPLRSTCVYLNNNRRYDRPTIFHELQVNVPRTMGILRDVVKSRDRGRVRGKVAVYQTIAIFQYVKFNFFRFTISFYTLVNV